MKNKTVPGHAIRYRLLVKPRACLKIESGKSNFIRYRFIEKMLIYRYVQSVCRYYSKDRMEAD